MLIENSKSQKDTVFTIMYIFKCTNDIINCLWIHIYVEKIKHGYYIYILILVRERDAEGAGISCISTSYLIFKKKDKKKM